MSKEKIAVLLAAYNGEKYIRTQIDSILNQQVDCELLLVVRDDGSTDSTVAIVERYAEKYPVRLIKGSNKGSVASFFDLLKYVKNNLADYDYISLSDQDDRWDLDKLQIAIDHLRKENRDIPLLYGCRSRLVDENLQKIPQEDTHYVIDLYNSIIQNFLPGHTYVMNRALLDLTFDADSQKIYVHDSYILNVAVINGKLIYDEIPHADYRQHQRNQLGATSRFDKWVTARWRRLKHGDGQKYSIQIEYIYEKFKSAMNEEQRNEIGDFLSARKNFIKRVRYISHTKLHRQKESENKMFYLMYVFGGYNRQRIRI